MNEFLSFVNKKDTARKTVVQGLRIIVGSFRLQENITYQLSMRCILWLLYACLHFVSSASIVHQTGLKIRYITERYVRVPFLCKQKGYCQKDSGLGPQDQCRVIQITGEHQLQENITYRRTLLTLTYQLFMRCILWLLSGGESNPCLPGEQR